MAGNHSGWDFITSSIKYHCLKHLSNYYFSILWTFELCGCHARCRSVYSEGFNNFLMKEILEIEKAHENILQSESAEVKFAVLLKFSDDSVFYVLR